MRVLVDPDQSDLNAVLATLLEEDVDITAREVARRHPKIKTVTAFTRNEARAQVIAEAQRRQQEVRAVALGSHRQRAASLGEQLERRGAKVLELETTVDALVASHVACVRAVLRQGGMPALERFWRDYKKIGDAVRAARAMPETAEVISLGDKKKRLAKDMPS